MMGVVFDLQLAQLRFRFDVAELNAVCCQWTLVGISLGGR